MRAKYTIELEVDDESIPVHLKEPGMLTKLELSQHYPDIDQDSSLNEMVTDTNFTTFLKKMVREVSDFPVALLDNLPADEFNKLTAACADTLAGEDPTVETDSFKHEETEEPENPFEDLDLSADGTVDTDDWR